MYSILCPYTLYRMYYSHTYTSIIVLSLYTVRLCVCGSSIQSLVRSYPLIATWASSRGSSTVSRSLMMTSSCTVGPPVGIYCRYKHTHCLPSKLPRCLCSGEHCNTAVQPVRAYEGQVQSWSDCYPSSAFWESPHWHWRWEDRGEYRGSRLQASAIV